MPKKNSVLKNLRAAKALIEKGWTRGALRNSIGSFCAIGAVSYSKDRQVHYHSSARSLAPEVNALWHALPEEQKQRYKDRGSSLAIKETAIVNFNDRTKKKKDVLDLFSRAICLLEKRAGSSPSPHRKTGKGTSPSSAG